MIKDYDLIAVMALAGLSVICLCLAVYAILRSRDPIAQRFRALEQGVVPRASMGGQSIFVKLGLKLLEPISRLATPSEGWQASRMRQNLIQAGYSSPSAPTVFMGLRVCVAAALPWLALIPFLQEKIPQGFTPLAMALFAAVGYILPNYFLDKAKESRGDKILRELPDVLDLLVITVEAGLGMDSAVRRVAKETSVSAPILATELEIMSLELRAGIPRDKALRNLAMRCGQEEVSSLTAMLIQADRFGVSIGRSLRVHSDSMRTKRRQLLEEDAAKIPLKLLFPVLFLIFPTILIVMAGPAIIRISEDMMK